jgi:hypothetical protein
MIKVVINAKTGVKTVTDLGTHPQDQDLSKQLAKVIFNLNKESVLNGSVSV